MRVTRTPERTLAKQNAEAIAELTGSKVLRYNRIHQYEPTWSYRVPLHADDFWFSILVSDGSYMLSGEHKRQRAYIAPFAFSFKYPWTNLATTQLLPEISGKLKVQTFSAKISDDSAFVGSPILNELGATLSKIDFDRVDIFFLNSVQIHFISEFEDALTCVQTCELLRKQVLTCFELLHVTKTK